MINPLKALKKFFLRTERAETYVDAKVETYVDVKVLEKMKERYRLAQLRAEVDYDDFYEAMKYACRIKAIEKMIEEQKERRKG